MSYKTQKGNYNTHHHDCKPSEGIVIIKCPCDGFFKFHLN